MKQASRFFVLAAVLVIGVSAFASPFTITSVSFTSSYPVTVTWDPTHIYVNWQGLGFSTRDFVNITVNGGTGLAGVQGFVEYDFPCQGCLYGNGGGPYAFSFPGTVLTETDPGYPFVQNDFVVGSGINISYLWSSSWTSAAFNGEVFTFTGTPVPEPGTLALLGSGILGMAGFVRRKLKM